MKFTNIFPKIVLWTLLVIGVIVTGLVFVMGSDLVDLPGSGEFSVPKATDAFLLTNYLFFGLAVLATVIFVIAGFIGNLRKDPKKALVTLAMILGFAVIPVVCWFLGSSAELQIVGYDGTDNVGAWAKMADAVMYTCYILFAGTLVAVVVNYVVSLIKKFI